MSSLATAAIVVAAGSAYVSHKNAKKSSKAQRRANEAQRKINKLKNAQSKRSFLRAFRQQQANVISAGVAAGVGIDSSAIQGSLNAQQRQRQLALREFDKMDELGGEQTIALNQASNYSARAATWGAVSNFATSFISFGGGGSSGGGSN